MNVLKRIPGGVVAAAILGICLLLSGFSSPNLRKHPDVAARSTVIKTVVLATPDIKVYEISAGGTPELRDEWSSQGRENVTKALLSCFSGKSMKISELQVDPAADQEFREIMALFETVSNSILIHTTSGGGNPNLFPDKQQNFDYSLGPLDKILGPSEGDALLLVYGVDQIATSGKKALNVLGTITGIAVGAFTGAVILPRMEGTALRMALADRNGTILWYNLKGGIYDLRDPASSAELVNGTLEDFPGLGK